MTKLKRVGTISECLQVHVAITPFMFAIQYLCRVCNVYVQYVMIYTVLQDVTFKEVI